MNLELSKTNQQNIEDIYPLSPMQEGMLFESLYAPETGAYFQQLICILTGNLDVKIFEQAWQQVVARHSIFRTVFLWESLSQPIQMVYRQVNLTVNTYDWRDLSAQDQQQQLETFLDSERQKGFQLSQAPLMRLHLIQLDSDTYQFVWCYHHLLLDGWSSPLVFKDLLDFYQAISHGGSLSNIRTISYRNYIAWLQQQDRDLAKKFWRQKFQGFTTPTPMIVDKPLSVEQHSSYAQQQIHLTVAATEAVVSFVRQHQLTMSNLVQATWGLLLSRYSQETDVVFGATVSGRPPELVGVESMVGLFINTLPVRVQIFENTELLGLLKDLQAQQVESEQFSYSSLVEIQGVSDVPRGTSLFESIVVFENYPVDAAVQQSNSHFSISNLRSIEQTNYPLVVLVAPGKQLLLKVMYNASRFEDDAISRMLGHFVTMLEAIVANPQQPISQLPMLTAPEQQQLLVDWNETQVNYPQDKCIHQLFEEQVERTPDAVAVVFENQQLTYHQLNCRANQLAHYLRSCGVGADVLVGICVERSVEMVVGLLGILKAGGAYVPLDPAYPQERLSYMLTASGVGVLLTQQQLVECLPKHEAVVVCLDSDWHDIAKHCEQNPITNTRSSNLAYTIYTSGSTGKPKGAGVYHRGFLNLVNWLITDFQFTSKDSTVLISSLSFDLTQKNIFAPLLIGGILYLPPDGFEPNYILDIVYKQRVSWINCTPSTFYSILTSGDDSFAQIQSLGYVFLGGEPIPLPSLLSWLNSPYCSAKIVNSYGPTECADVCSAYTVEQPNEFLNKPIPIGKPIPNVKLYILDPNLQLVPVGVIGELCITGVGVGIGYVNDLQRTNEKFISNPFQRSRGAQDLLSSGGERLYKTGDLARYLPDGNIEYLGRIDNQVKIRGFRIELGEIEAALSKHSDVQVCCVITREDVPGDKRLVAYVVPQAHITPKVNELRGFLKEKLPEYMVPSAFVLLESLPLTPNGKVDRRALPEPELSSELLEKYVAPRTPIEEILALIWQQVLKVERVGTHDNFFELGGHSLLATQLISRIRTNFKVELPLQSLFAAPTIAQLASSIQQLQQQNLELVAPPILPRPENAEIPLSFAQQRLWFLDQFETNSSFYNIPVALHIAGTLQVAVLEQSFIEIIHRHEALRTNFVAVNGKPTQVIQAPTNWTITVVDLQHLPSLVLSEVEVTEQKTVAQKLLQQQAIEPFDLASDSLIRATLVVLSATEQWLLVCMHHIVSDGWSMSVFVEELTTLYHAYLQGQASPLSPLPIQYADFALWQRQWLVGEVLQSQLSYWQQQLANAPTFLPLPTDRPRPAVQTFNGADLEFTLSVDLTQKLIQLSQQQGCTLFMTLLAAYNTLLYRYTGQTDILVGTPIANRDRSEIEGLIGFFVNTLVMRSNLAENPSFSELLPRIREMALGAYAHQDLPFEMLVEVLQPERDMSHTPLFQVMFVFHNTPESEIELTELSVSSLPIETYTAKFDISLVIMNTTTGLVGGWEYNTDLFDSSTIERMSGHFVRLLESIVANPQECISQLPMLTKSEQQQLLVEWNNTQLDYPQDKCIHELFEQQVERTPNAVAVVFENQQLTYHQLNCRANQLAHYLRSQGVGPDVLVGICFERSVEMIVGLLGILKAGGAYMPLDPEYPISRLQFMLENAQIKVLLTQHLLVNKLPEHTAQLVCLDTDWHLISQGSQENVITGLSATHLAYVIYTSGSTGQPKGVEVVHRGVNRLLFGANYVHLDATQRFLQMAPISFDASTFEIWGALLHGAKCVLFSGKIPTAKNLKHEIQRHEITTLWLTSALFNTIIDDDPQALSGIRQLLIGGEALSVAHVYKGLQNLPETQIINGYGPTESTTFTCCHPIPRQIEPTIQSIPIGRPIANTQVYILDSHLQLVPIGVPGELHIGGAGLARGYLNARELTQERFVPNPFDQSKFKHRKSKLYKTGDLARYLPNGNIEYLGRIDNQVKIRGFRIELGEIEAVLSQHSDVQVSCVIVREDTPGDKRLVAYVVTHQNCQSTSSEIRQFLKAKLPDYMVPSAIVTLESLPLNLNGKVDKSALPKPELDTTLLEQYVAPRTPIEEMLVHLWAQVLRVQQVGIYDNFFELGGHSLLATQLISRIRTNFKVELPLRELFAQATVAELAQSVEQLQQEDLKFSTPPILKRAENAELALSYAQQRLWFLDQFEPDSPFYNIPIALYLAGTLQIAALEQSLQEIIARHEALRTNFITVDGKPTQIIHTESHWRLSVVDLKHLSTLEQEIATQEIAQQEAIQPFDLATQALIRATLVVQSQTKHVLLLCIHHIVSDGWSMSLFVQELAALYNAYSEGKTPTLAPLPIQYADFALWQRQWLQGDVLQSQLSYWQKQLAGAPALLVLPTDRPRPSVQTYHGTLQEFALSVELTTKLTKLSQEQGVTLFMTLLAAFDTLLYRYTGTEDILVGSPIANRDRSEIEGLIGFFVNTLVMRTDLAGNPSFSELLGRVREMAMDAYAHQNLPFEMLVEALQPERNLSYTPLFQVMFVLQNAPTSGLEMTGLSVSPSPIKGRTSRYDLTLMMQNTTTGLVGLWEYNTDLFDGSTIERMTSHFVTLLEGIIANPDQRISQLPLLKEVEQRQLLLEWNDTGVDYPLDKSIHQLFESQVKRTPDAVAVEFVDEQLTYNQLNGRANQLADYLRSLGVEPDVLVGLCVERSLEMVIGILGILKAGAAYVPLDPEYPKERLNFILEDTHVKVLLTQQSLVDQLPPNQAQLVCLDTDAGVISQFSQDNLICGIPVNNLAYIIYTSGSTGQPKGIAMSQRALCNHILWHRDNLKISRGAKTLQFASINFDVSFQEIFTTWCSGGTLFLIGEELRRDASALLDFLQLKAIERMFLPFVGLQQLAEVAVGSELVNSHLREIITSGEQLQITPAISGWFSKLSDCTLQNQYGPSESHLATSFTLNNSVENWPLLPPIGRPIANTQIYILDKYLQPVPIGVPGEVYIGGVLLAQGYLNRPELTQKSFIPNPFSDDPHSLLYKTGDLARYLPDGNIEYLGRIDNQVKIRGFRIELGEVETVLSQYPLVQAACAIARVDNSGDQRLVAYIVPQKDKTLIVSELRSFLKEKLPEYMLPTAIVVLDALPLTPNRKIDRRALPAPDLHSQSSDKYVAPRNPIEEILASIWAQVLKVEQVGIHDNFFELGGHSLLATQLVSRIRSNFQIELPLQNLFAAPTIAELSLLIQRLQQQDLQISAPPILRRAEDAQIPLSYAQQRLWFLDQFEPNSALYTIPVGLCLVGTLNVTALEQSFIEIIHRHEALHTNFVAVNGKPTQVIQTPTNWTITVVDLQHLPSLVLSEAEVTEQTTVAHKLVQQQAIEPFALASDSLIRATLVVLSGTEQWLLVCMHHIVSDGWSMSVFVEELITLYNAYLQGKPSPLSPLPIQYADFAIWQRQWLQAEVLQSQLSYWQQQLADAPTFLPLPTDRPRPAVQTFKGAHLEFTLSVELTQQLTKQSHEFGVTLFMTLLAAYNTLLYRYTGQTDILMGTPIANRDRSEIEGLIGFFVNTLVMRTDLAGNPSFSELLGRVREMALGAYAHQDLPFEMLVEALQPERDMSHTPLFQVMFVLQNTPTTEIELTGLSVSSLPMESSTAKFDLTLVMENSLNGLVGWWQYNTDLLDSTTIERMSSHFVTLLEGIVAHPHERISQLPILTASEEQQLLIEWNRTVKDYPQDKCIHQLFEEQVERTPNAVAVVFEEQQLTYDQLNCRANQLAHYLHGCGVGAGVLVGICLERSVEMVVGLLAILKAGGAYIPLDPEYPQQRLKFMLEDSQVKVLVTQQHLVERLPEDQAKLVCLDGVWSEILQQKQNNPIQVVTSIDLANVIYTSGSTGKPKGVMVEHSGLCNLAIALIQAFSLNCDSRVLQFASFSFDACVSEIFMAWGSGARLYLGTSHSLMPGMPLIQRFRDNGITHVILPPSALAVLPQEELPTLQTIIVAGEACPLELMRQWSKGRNFFNAYGPTEASVCAAIAPCTPLDQKISIGRPIDNTQIYILDQNEKPVPVGVPGELHIGGAGLARGYLHRPELTLEKFIPNPFQTSRGGERLYKTGDLARYLPDGTIEYLGRIDHQVKIRGFRIELGEIETILSQYPGVRENVVVMREDISGEKRLVAYFVPQLEQRPTTNELRIFLKEKLPHYMVPSTFVSLEFLPLTPNGKLDRKALRVPDADNTQLAGSFVAPRTPVEKVLADIWADVLHLKQVGVLDNFFDLGGHSLTTIQVMSQVNETLQINLPLRYLFTSPTVAELAQTIEFTSQGDSTVTANKTATVDLQAEVVLDQTINPGNLVYQFVSQPSAIFLTGATGFVGAFLLAELLQQTQADIYCLVRATNLTAGKQRLEETLKAYLLWDGSFNSRIIPVLGDLSQPLLGLSNEEFDFMARKIDSIYHNGALVNNIYPYALFKAPNVGGTEEVLRLASQIKIKPVHFISTASVFNSDEYFKLEVILENDPLEHSQGLLGGYTQSKWVAEKIVMMARDRGLPCSIYRLGRVTWDSETGVWNPNDLFYRFIKSCIQLKSAPEMNTMEKITPVDCLAKALIHLSQQPESLGKAFHLISSHSAPWSQFINCIRSLGYPLQQLSYEDWLAELLRSTQNSADNALYSFVSLASGNNTSSQKTSNEIPSLKFDSQNTLNGLADTTIRWPEVGEELLLTFFANFSNQTLENKGN